MCLFIMDQGKDADTVTDEDALRAEPAVDDLLTLASLNITPRSAD